MEKKILNNVNCLDGGDGEEQKCDIWELVLAGYQRSLGEPYVKPTLIKCFGVVSLVIV